MMIISYFWLNDKLLIVITDVVLMAKLIPLRRFTAESSEQCDEISF